jgi:hypothetical protein
MLTIASKVLRSGMSAEPLRDLVIGKIVCLSNFRFSVDAVALKAASFAQNCPNRAAESPTWRLIVQTGKGPSPGLAAMITLSLPTGYVEVWGGTWI